MRRACVLSAVLLAWLSDQANQWPKGDPDLAKLQGKWRLVSHRPAGGTETRDAIWELRVKGDRYTLSADGTTSTGVIRLDSSKTPKQLDYTVVDEDGEVTAYLGIYELDGDTYRTCDVEKGKDARPTEFRTDAKTGQVAVWKKVKTKD